MLKYISLIFPILLAVAFLTLFERKLLGAVQRRKGPNVIGFWGLLQPFADAFKLLLKEIVVPSVANKFSFFSAPVLIFGLSLLSWLVIPFGSGFVLIDINIGILYIFAISSLNVYGLIIAGWASNSRYAFLGALRSSAQMISYEVSIGLILLSLVLVVASLNLNDIILFQKYSIWFIIPFFPCYLLFLISMLAETNRAPFDLPEAEAELVSGYNVEYSSIGFALFFIGEYANIILMSSFCTVLFFGGWSFFGFDNVINMYCSLIIFIIKIILHVVFFIMVRSAYPRYRYDQLMQLGWKVFLPLSFSYLFLNSSVLYFFNGLFYFF